ncbi:hypothetical protein BJ878DRAFT_580648 [Calycina marina]|uniref:DUF1765-domain-containing protein n=1 Tax=Calycina marina TaxID=1763456 RepID=A0A9P8CJJ9_9HELO|nr:hypothetical protein BJ878DRAFT_580648 [Calycina marina]
MNGVVSTMPVIFNGSTAFPRAQSYNNIPILSKPALARRRTREPDEDEELPRSASYSSIPNIEYAHYAINKDSLRVNSAEVSPSPNSKHNEGKTALTKKRTTTPVREVEVTHERVGGRKSPIAQPKSWIQRASLAKNVREALEAPDQTVFMANDIPPVPSIPQATSDKTKGVSESFATFARKLSSRSPSPSRKSIQDKSPLEPLGNFDASASTVSSSTPRRLSLIQPKLDEPSPVIPSTGPPKISRRQSTIQKLKQRPQNVLMNLTTFASTNSSASSLPRSSADDWSTPRTSTDKVAPLPSFEKLQNLSAEAAPKKDELSTAFRSLENDFTKFQAKTWSLKTNVVRSQLLPFLKNHVNHHSNTNLCPQDLERRAIILNKWWRGLLDVLDCRQNQKVSGVDRPVLLEAAVAIMVRPEWRLGSSMFSPSAERCANRAPERNSLNREESILIDSATTTQFVVDSIYHNIRNMFIENLLSQIIFAVDKMSLRHVPASLVTFCGKAFAYAFFFAPGVAEILVRIWKLDAEGIRRVATELGLPRRPNRVDMDEVIAAFPSHMHTLGWSSARSMSSYLLQAPDIPMSTKLIPWGGPWQGRWCGRDSDMFFVFVKHYFILVEEIIPWGLSLAGKARAPGFVLVQAQILSVLEDTIHRQPVVEPPPVTFDELLSGVDASVATLPSPSNNSTRLMAENRLIMLLRDFMAEQSSEYELARMTFAETFAKLTEATAKKTPVFNHSPCYLLCDFLEEALIVYLRFQQDHCSEQEVDFINWLFWLDVCKKMLESHNTLTELRLFSFIYTIWAVISADERRKESVCLEWLVTEETFDRYFNHWCPMVRAYYMRLLCWRMCRDDGESSDLDTMIFSAVSLLLNAGFGKYLFLKQTSQTSNVLPPSIVPSHPAPGRRLLIIRNDNRTPATSQFVNFDGIIGSSTSRKSGSNSLTTQLASELVKKPDLKITSSTPPPSKQSRWTFLSKILPLSFNSESQESPITLTPGPVKTLEEARQETATARGVLVRNVSSESGTPTITSTHRAFSFKFSLEWPQNYHKQNHQQLKLSSQGTRRRAPSTANSNFRGDRRLVPPRLPAPAQAWIESRVPDIGKEPLPIDPAGDTKTGDSVTRAKYSGRALAEWTLIVGECNNFTERRRDEGVPNLKCVEVPTLGVDGLKKFS